MKGPDALSRRRPTKQEIIEVQEDDDWLDDFTLYVWEKHLEDNILNGQNFLAENTFIIDNSKSDQLLQEIKTFLEDNVLPEFDNEQDKRRFIQKSHQFFIKNGHLYKRRKNKLPLTVILTASERMKILQQAHESLAHRGIYGVFQTIRRRFYWPRLYQDVEQHIKSCHECQICSVKKVEIPVTISAPATIFSKLYIDVMLMPKARGYRYIVAARDGCRRQSTTETFSCKFS